MRPTTEQLETGESSTIPVRWTYPLSEAAELMGVSTDTVKRMADDQEIDIVQAPGRRVRLVEGAEIQRWIADNRIPRRSK